MGKNITFVMEQELVLNLAISRHVSSIWRENLIFVINTHEDKFIVVDNKGIIPLASDYIQRSEKHKTSNFINTSLLITSSFVIWNKLKK